MGYKRGGGPGACWGFMIWGPFGARSGPVWGPIYFGAHLGLFGAHLDPIWVPFGAHLGPFGAQELNKVLKSARNQPREQRQHELELSNAHRQLEQKSFDP